MPSVKYFGVQNDEKMAIFMTWAKRCFFTIARSGVLQSENKVDFRIPRQILGRIGPGATDIVAHISKAQGGARRRTEFYWPSTTPWS
jgi:hypothetical protein